MKMKKRVVQNSCHHVTLVTLVTHPKGVNNSYEKKVYKNVFAYYSI